MLLYPAAMAAAVLRELPRRDGGRPRRGRLGRRAAHRAARGLRPRAGARAAGGRRDRLLRGPGRGGRGGAAAAARVRAAGGRPGRADAVRGAAAADRRRLPAGLRNYWTGDFLTGLPDEAIEVLCRFHRVQAVAADRRSSLLPGGGAGARVPDGTMAIGEREAPFNIHITSLWADPADDEANIAWTRELSAAMQAVHDRPRVRELHRRRGPGAGRRVVRRGRATRACRRSRTATTPATCSAATRTCGRAGSVAHGREVEPVRRRGRAGLRARAARQQPLEVRARCGGRRRPPASSRRGSGSCGA